MQKLNNEIQNWHSGFYRKLFYLVVFIALIAPVAIYLPDKAQEANQAQVQSLISHHQVYAATDKLGPTLSFEPESRDVAVGETFSVDIILDTAGNDVDGVDIYALNYDPSLLDVIDDMPEQSGTQIKAGSLINPTGDSSGNSVNETEGKILFSQTAVGTPDFNGNGVLATIQFKALKEGDANLMFDFIPGSTVETNVVSHGTDLLSEVSEANYSITNY